MMTYNRMHQALLFAVGFLFLSSSTSSSFGSLSHAKFSKTYNNNLTKTTSFRRSNPLLQRGGSDEPASTEESDVAASTSTALLAESDSNTESVASVEVPSPMGPNASKPGILRKLFPSLPWHTVPNLLTYARCLAIPALIVQFYTSTHANKHIHSSLIFAIASITDYLDGYLARRWDICSPFGAFLDPVADKLMVSTALILLTGKYGYLVAIPTAIILAREIAVSALREWMASRGARDSVKVGFQGKVKTAATMVALTIVLSVPDSVGLAWTLKSMKIDVMSIGMALLFLSSFVTVTSGSVYFKAAAPVLMGKE